MWLIALKHTGIDHCNDLESVEKSVFKSYKPKLTQT